MRHSDDHPVQPPGAAEASLVGGVALAVLNLPARRAASADPMETLRTE
jgi:hypothetical protein